MYRVVAASAAVLAAVVLVALALVGFHGGTKVERNVFVNPAGLINAYSTPSLTIDPRAPKDVVVVYRQDRPSLSAGMAWSADGGVTFHPTTLPLPPGSDHPFFPDATFGPDGTLYVTYANLVGAGNVPGALWATTSADDGRTLAAPTMIATGMTFQPRIAAGTAGDVDLTWVLEGRRTAGAPLTGNLVQLMTARSSDRGRTWSSPVQVNPADGNLVSGASTVVDDGSQIVTYERFGSSESTLITGATATQAQPYDIVVTRSQPGSTTFSAPVVVASGVTTAQRFSLFFPQFPSMAAGPDRSLYLAWDKNLTHGQDVLVARSQNDGTSWSAPVRANDNPTGDGTARQLPTVSVAPDGRVDVVMVDQRNDHTGLFAEIYLASSTNRGQSFQNVLVSSAAFNTQIGPSFGGGLPADLGAHLGVASESGSVVAAWADSRLGTDTTGRQDIVAARVEMTKAGSGRTLLLVAAGLLLVAAAVVLVVRRRPREDRPGERLSHNGRSADGEQ